MKVLLGIDASEASQHLVSEAAARPWPPGTTFGVIHVVDLSSFVRVPALIEAEKQSAGIFVKAAAEKLGRSGFEITSDVVVDFPRKGVTDYATNWGADLIMVGSHGQSALSRFLLGSVAQGVLRTAPCSVEVVRASAHGVPASSRAMKILLATDGSEFSAAAATSLARRPWPKGSQVKVVSAIELLIPQNAISAAPLSSVYPASLLEEIWSDARRRGHDAVESARSAVGASGAGFVVTVSAPVGDPRVVILGQADAWGADLIVLGSHGWRGIDRLLMGSVSESIALHAKCSVEVIRL
jgi:nucleotide-binding universal stress UspA family protein